MNPILANALTQAWVDTDRAGCFLLCVLIMVLIGSGVIFSRSSMKLMRLRLATRRFTAAYRASRDPFHPSELAGDFAGVPAYEALRAGAEEWARLSGTGGTPGRNRGLLKNDTRRNVRAAADRGGQEVLGDCERVIARLLALRDRRASCRERV